MNTETTIEMATTNITAFPTVKKWEAGAGLGPRMAKVFNDAIKKAQWAAKGTQELTGILGKPETEKRGMVFVSLYGGGMHAEYTPRLAAIQEKHGATITPDNYKAIAADVLEMAAWFNANPMIHDKRVSQEAHDKERAETSAAIKASDERIAKETEARRVAFEAVKAKYPWAKHDGTMHANAAANMRTLLAQAFPGITFRVTSESYSGGSSIRCSWVMGPRSEDVKKITDQFQRCQFDGSQDLETHRDDTRAFTEWMGGASYVTNNRDVNAECAHVRSLLEAAGGSSWESEGYHSITETARRLIADTSFPAGAEIVGVAKLDEPREGASGFEAYYRIMFAAPEASATPAPTAPTTSASGITVSRNVEKGGVELRFPQKPSEAVLDRVKGAGFRWSRFSGCWWNKASVASLAFAYELAGVPNPDNAEKSVSSGEAHASKVATPEPEIVRDPGEDAADRWNELQNAGQC